VVFPGRQTLARRRRYDPKAALISGWVGAGGDRIESCVAARLSAMGPRLLRLGRQVPISYDLPVVGAPGTS